MKPVHQGALDGLCGVYAIINAVSLVLDTKERSSLHEGLFSHLAYGLGAPAFLATTEQGLRAHDMLRAVDFAFKWLSIEYGIELIMVQPYRTALFPTKAAFISVLRSKIATPDTAVIIQVKLPGMRHWTVARGIRGRRLALYDSAGVPRIDLGEFSLNRGSNQFLPSETLVIQQTA